MWSLQEKVSFGLGSFFIYAFSRWLFIDFHSLRFMFLFLELVHTELLCFKLWKHAKIKQNEEESVTITEGSFQLKGLTFKSCEELQPLVEKH